MGEGHMSNIEHPMSIIRQGGKKMPNDRCLYVNIRLSNIRQDKKGMGKDVGVAILF